LAAAVGLILVAASIVALWFFFPKGGRPNPLLRLPLMESLVPLAIVSAIALGATMAISGIW
jgi:hypothetical protein